VREPKFTLAAVLPLILLSYPANAQWIGQIQTESDWETLLEQGYYDYNSFQLYRDLAEGEATQDTIGYIQNALGNSLSDLISPISVSTLKHAGTGFESRNIQFRSGQKIQDGRNTGYYLLSSSYQDFEVEYKGRNENSAWKTERRSLSYSNDNVGLIVGNYAADIGLGLGIGRYDYRPVLVPKDSIKSDLLFPDNSYYNGAKIEINNRFTIMFSSKSYLSVHKNYWGGAITQPVGNSILGLTGGATHLSSNGKKRTLGASSVFYSNSEKGFSSELGYGESGAGLVCDFRKRNFDIKFWHYSNSFINPQSSGMANPDYIIFNDNRFPVSYRQAQTGESGLSVQRSLSIGTLQLAGWGSAWKRSPHDPISLDNSLGARLALGDKVSLNARYAERFGRVSGRTILEAGSSYHEGFEVSGLVSYWIDGNHADNSKSFAHIYISVPIKNRLLANIRLRSHFDGKIEYFIEEKTTITDRFSLKATYRWQDTWGRESGPLYIVMETNY
jgi:hypothetical protein